MRKFFAPRTPRGAPTRAVPARWGEAAQTVQSSTSVLFSRGPRAVWGGSTDRAIIHVCAFLARSARGGGRLHRPCNHPRLCFSRAVPARWGEAAQTVQSSTSVLFSRGPRAVGG